MSQFITKLRDGTGRDGIDWPSPPGTWKQGESINRLQTFADNLDVSQTPGDTDLLNSVPTPWARLLLFESALYNTRHPSHFDIEQQWRGLLGVLALAEPLRLNLEMSSISIDGTLESRVARSFSDLRPRYLMSDVDTEGGKWDRFQMVRVDGQLLGSTTPRTLVFTGVAHRCPSSIPFQSQNSRLSDPVVYYKRFGDRFYLGLLASWIRDLRSTLQQDTKLRDWLGSVPAAPGAAPTERMALLIERLDDWLNDLSSVQRVPIEGTPSSRFTLFPFSAVKGIPPVTESGDSSLYLRGRRDVMVCYDPLRGSRLLNAFDQELVNEPLKVYDGRWIQANQPLPVPFNFLPPNLRDNVIEDPTSFLEDALIQVNLPSNPEAVYPLRVGDERSSRTYLFPFKPEVFKYFSSSEIAENTRIVPNPQSSSLRLEWRIPLDDNRKIQVSKDYQLDSAVRVNTKNAELVAWPDFSCSAWTRYLYLKTSVARQEIDFEPLVKCTSRARSGYTWYVASQAAEAFVGSLDGKKGLLLLRNNIVEAPSKYWRIAVDFGSTHTRAFSLLLEKRGDDYVTSQGASIQPIRFRARARSLTYVTPDEVRNVFLPLIGYLTPPDRDELKTLLMMPETNPEDLDDWLPREGYVYLYLLSGDYDPDHLRYNLKWNSHKNDPDLRAFLRCLLMMLEAEATQQGALVVSVAHTYPSVFSESLVAKHNGEWQGLENYLNSDSSHLTPSVRVHPASMTETVAVCRHLEWEQDALPTANTISLDVGGSTTDIAVWANKKLQLQESVKMAAGIVGQYLQSPAALDFLKWLEDVLRNAPHNHKSLSLSLFSNKPSGYSLMFNNILTVVEWAGNLQILVDQINGATQSRKLMSHIIYLWGALLYYAGLLARRADLPRKQDTYYIYFCGKGGTMIKWVRGSDVLAQQMFTAGLLGPSEGTYPIAPTVMARMSAMPKEEVGRGLLALSALEGNTKGKSIGLVDPNPPSVTVGETGYMGLEWNGDLTPGALLQLPDSEVPVMKDLRELNAFRKAFCEGAATQAAAKELGIDSVQPNIFQSRLVQRLFGTTKGCVVTDLRNNDPDALLEPLFITEAKVLIELATQNDVFA